MPSHRRRLRSCRCPADNQTRLVAQILSRDTERKWTGVSE